jgi:hypothetical protein
MAYTRKTRDEWQLWINYGQGWEHETSESSWSDYVKQRDCYRANCPQYPVKLKMKRVPIAGAGE